MNKEARKVTSYFIADSSVSNSNGDLLSIPELYLQVLDDLIGGITHPEYTSLLNQELVNELFRLPSKPVIRSKANGKDIVFNVALENDYCMPVLRELLSTIVIDKLGYTAETKGLIDAIKKGESFASPQTRKNKREARTASDFDELYAALVETAKPFVNWFFNEYLTESNVAITYRLINNKRKRMVFYFEWPSDNELVIMVNVGSNDAPYSSSILTDNDIVEFVDHRYVTKQSHIGSQVDRVIFNELAPQLVFALTVNKPMCLHFFSEEPPINATVKTVLTKKLREEINSRWTYEKLDLSEV